MRCAADVDDYEDNDGHADDDGFWAALLPHATLATKLLAQLSKHTRKDKQISRGTHAIMQLEGHMHFGTRNLWKLTQQLQWDITCEITCGVLAATQESWTALARNPQAQSAPAAGETTPAPLCGRARNQLHGLGCVLCSHHLLPLLLALRLGVQP